MATNLLDFNVIAPPGDNVPAMAASAVDFDGVPRVLDGTGNALEMVDLGAYEFILDSDGDGTPDYIDTDDDNDGVLDGADCAPTLKGVIAEARIVITNDTGPRHVAAALGTPVVSLFGPTDPRWTTIDFPMEKVLTAEPFLPSQLTADDHAASCAIERITVADVLAATAQLLAAGGPESLPSRGAAPETMPPDSAGTP